MQVRRAKMLFSTRLPGGVCVCRHAYRVHRVVSHREGNPKATCVSRCSCQEFVRSLDWRDYHVLVRWVYAE